MGEVAALIVIFIGLGSGGARARSYAVLRLIGTEGLGYVRGRDEAVRKWRINGKLRGDMGRVSVFMEN